MSSKDIQSILDGWSYKPGQITVRRIRGRDNQIRLQMRVDLGVLQMELVNRPDGFRPHNCDSLLDYHLSQLEAHERRNGTELGFTLSAEQCQAVRDESLQYYQRYLANFALEDYESVVSDTQHNLDILDLCARYADEESDRYALEMYRPSIVMMQARSKALAAMENDAYLTALAHVQNGVDTIRDFFRDYGDRQSYRHSSEIAVLKALRREIRRHLPTDPIRQLKRRIKRAVTEERYEEAAALRDQLEALLRDHGNRS